MAANFVRCPRDRGESVKGGLPPPFHNQTARIANPEGICDSGAKRRGVRKGAPTSQPIKPGNHNLGESGAPFRTPRPSGGGGIRTHGTVAGTPAFRAGQFSHSCTPPGSGGTRNSTPLRVRSARGLWFWRRNLAPANRRGGGRARLTLSPRFRRQTNAKAPICVTANCAEGWFPFEGSSRLRWR